MSENSRPEEKLPLDAIKLNRMKTRIFYVERSNIFTNARTDNQMIDIVKQIIIEEAKKCY